MSQFTAQIHARTIDALTSLHTAEVEEDLHLVDIRTGELESLARVAADHDVEIPELQPYRPIAV